MTQKTPLPAHADHDQAIARWLDTAYSADYDRRQALNVFAKGGLTAALAALVGSLPQGAAAAPDDEVVRAGYLPITDASALLVAHAKGFFADEGLEAERPTLIRGWAPLIEGFVGGKFNLAHFLNPIPIWMRYSSNFPVKVLSWIHTNGSGVVLGRHVEATDFAGLGGSAIAVPFWYSMHNIVLQQALRQAGLEPVILDSNTAPGPKQVALQIMAPPEMPAALAAKKIDGYIVAEPFNAFGELKAGARMLRFTGDIWRDHPCCVLCTQEEMTTAKPEWTQAVVNAVTRATLYCAENKAEVAHLISADGEGYLPAPAAVVERAMTLYDTPEYIDSGAIRHPEWEIGRIDFNPWPYPSADQLTVEKLRETVVSGETGFLDSLDPAHVSDDLFDRSFVRRALAAYPDWAAGRADPFTRIEELVV